MSKSSRVLISFRNAADAGDLTGSTGWSAQLPAANLLTENPTQMARTEGLTATVVVDLGRLTPLTMAALLGHNGSVTATWRVEASRAEDFSTVELDTGTTNMRPVTVPFGTRPWAAGPWNGREATGAADALAFFSSVYVRYVRLTLADPDRLDGIGYLQAYRLILDSPWRPSRNFSYGWDVQHKDPSVKRRSRGGTLYAERRAGWRRMTFSLDHMSRAEAWAQADDLSVLRGVGGHVLVIADPSDVVNRPRFTIYGVLEDLTPTTNTFHANFARRFAVEQNR